MGTSHRIVRKVSSEPENPGASSPADPCVFASVQKCEAFRGSRRRTLPTPPLKAPTSSKRCFIRYSLLHFRVNSPSAPKPAPVVLTSGKMYGFPTDAANAPVHSPSPRRPRESHHRKAPRQPRARECIPRHRLIARSKHLRLART